MQKLQEFIQMATDSPVLFPFLAFIYVALLCAAASGLNQLLGILF